MVFDEVFTQHGTGQDHNVGRVLAQRVQRWVGVVVMQDVEMDVGIQPRDRVQASAQGGFPDMREVVKRDAAAQAIFFKCSRVDSMVPSVWAMTVPSGVSLQPVRLRTKSRLSK